MIYSIVICTVGNYNTIIIIIIPTLPGFRTVGYIIEEDILWIIFAYGRCGERIASLPPAAASPQHTCTRAPCIAHTPNAAALMARIVFTEITKVA